jgi:hypothetical protein
MGNVLFLAGGIDHQEKGLRPPAGDNQVIQHTATAVGQQGIGLAVASKADDIRRHQGFQPLRRARARNDDLPHVRHVEQARRLSGMEVFLDDACGVLHRHVVTGKRHHAGTKFPVQGVERSVQQGHRQRLGSV